MTRPKYPKPDGNNRIVVTALENLCGYDIPADSARVRYSVLGWGQVITALNISSLPNQIDWLILSTDGWYIPVEVKEPGKEDDLTDGEREWLATVPPVLIATSADDVLEAIMRKLSKA